MHQRQQVDGHTAGAPSPRATHEVAASLLIEAGAVLSTSLDPETTMGQVARLTVPLIADLCIIDLRDADGSIKGVGIAAADEQAAHRLEQLRAEHPIDAAGDHPVAEVIRSGRPQLLAELDQEQLRRFASDEEHAEFMIGSDYRSAVVAPLAARSRILGAISLLRFGDCAPYTDSDLELTGELARRAALAIDNARLYSDLRSLEQRLEAILLELAEAVTVVDRRGHTIFANRAAILLLGASAVEELSAGEPGSTMGRFLVLDEDGNELTLDQMPARRLLRGEDAAPLLAHNIIRETGEERWLIVRASPIMDPDTGEVAFAVNVFEDITELKRAQIAESFLADASQVLSSSLDEREVLEAIAQLAVPRLADMCSVSVLGPNDEVLVVALHHTDPEKLALASELRRDYPAHIDDPAGTAEVIRTGQPVHSSVEPAALSAYARDERHEALLRKLGIASVVIVPMTAGGRPVGAITLASEEGRRRLTPTDLGLAVELGRRAGIALENARLYTERTRIASALQQALLPEALPDIPGVEVAALYAAAGELNEVGGDFYDVFQHFDGRWVLAIGDVCGKGPRAAAVTALARHTLRAAALSGQAPRVLLISVHQALMNQPPGLDMCTMAIILTDLRPPNAHLTIVLAGHPHPLVVKPDGTVTPIGRPGTLLGVIDPPRIEQEEVQLNPGDTLILYTDGVSEAGAPAHPLGDDGLLEICAQAPKRPLKDLLAAIERAAVERARGTARDDIALLALRLRSDQR